MGDPEWPRDEYDCMVGPVMRLLENGASDGDIAAYLRAEVTDHFGLSPEHYDFRSVARRTRSWFQERWAAAQVSNLEDPLQVSGDIVNTGPSGTKPR
jgi:hypothetical protein